MAYTIAQLLVEARGILNDVSAAGNPPTRYTDQELLNAFNDAMQQARSKRPDAFLSIGLRNQIPQYTAADLSSNTVFPLDNIFYPAFIFYVTGRTEMKEDTFSDDGRAAMLMQRFTAMLMSSSG